MKFKKLKLYMGPRGFCRTCGRDTPPYGALIHKVTCSGEPQWEDFTGDYEKDFYEVKLPTKEIVRCWPNAGYMNSLDGSRRKFSVEDGVKIKRSVEEYG